MMVSIATGIGLAIGFIIGNTFVLGSLILFILYKMNKPKKLKITDKLIEAFEKYKAEQIQDNNFGVLAELDSIITQMKNKTYPDELENYEVTKKSELVMEDSVTGKSRFKFEYEYVIERLEEETEEE